MAAASVCKIEGCDKPALARSMCGKHYQRWRITADDNEVRSVAKPGEPRRWLEDHANHTGDECLLWPFARYPSGYGMLNTPEGAVTASRVMCEIANGPAPEEIAQAAHRCGNGAQGCISPSHLYWASRPENEADKVAHGTSNRGDRNGHAKLTPDIVRAIRRSPEGPAAIAQRYEISAPTVCDIRARRSWAWLD